MFSGTAVLDCNVDYLCRDCDGEEMIHSHGMSPRSVVLLYLTVFY